AQRLWDQAWLLNVADSYYAEWSQLYLRNWASHELYYLIDRQGAFAIEHVWLDK
ncbi:MAG: hypothetical protein HY686_04105, partial [Chloroflexi bacterium]|nr:hypothetical protein [Chloroflexota bacterium]